YDIARCFEHLPATATDELELPDAQLMLVDTLVAFDHVKHRLLVIAHARIEGDVELAYRAAVQRVEEFAKHLQDTVPSGPAVQRGAANSAEAALDTPLRSNMTPEQYQSHVRRAKEYIAAGEAFQVVL